MIGFKDDGFESLRYKLRTMSESELLRFGREARRKCAEALKKELCWKELKLAREEWRSRHRRRRV